MLSKGSKTAVDRVNGVMLAAVLEVPCCVGVDAIATNVLLDGHNTNKNVGLIYFE